MHERPHVCPALKQLRAWVSLAALGLVLCAAAQMLVFACVHYTDSRWEQIETTVHEAPLSVVLSDDPNQPGKDQPAAAAATPANPAEPVNPNRILTSADSTMRTVSSIAQGVGVIAGLSLILLTMLGVLIACGATVPGVEKAVTSCVWASVLGIICVPWRDVLPSMVFPGVFTGYDRIIAASEGWDAATRSAPSALAQYFLLPLVVGVGATMVMLWFRAGVERGTIITAVSDLEDALEREMHDIRRRGIVSSAPRSVGALNRALGDTGDRPLGSSPPNQSMGPVPAMPSSAIEPPHLRLSATSSNADSMTGLAPSMARKSGRRRGDADDDRRPI